MWSIIHSSILLMVRAILHSSWQTVPIRYNVLNAINARFKSLIAAINPIKKFINLQL